MSETKIVKCDGFGCRNTVERTEYEISVGWMHIEAWYRPEDSDGKYSGCGGMDLCPACARKWQITDDLAVRCIEDYDKNVRRHADGADRPVTLYRVRDMRAPSHNPVPGQAHAQVPAGQAEG